MVEQELRNALGKNIKFLRFRRQFSQADLAEKAHISITFLSNIERGNNFPQAGTLCNIAEALDIQVWELFKGEGPLGIQENEIVDRLSGDFMINVKNAMETVYKQYKS